MATMRIQETCSGRFFFARIKKRIIICADALTDNALAHRLSPIEARHGATKAAMPRVVPERSLTLKRNNQTDRIASAGDRRSDSPERLPTRGRTSTADDGIARTVRMTQHAMQGA